MMPGGLPLARSHCAASRMEAAVNTSSRLSIVHFAIFERLEMALRLHFIRR
jgi:hypothetical protein